MGTTQDGTIAELQRTIAGLRQALSERDATLAQRNSEYGERIEQQSATIDVLKAMSASPGDAQPVFDLIVRRAQQLCNAMTASLYEYDGELIHLRSDDGNQPVVATPAATAYRSQFPMAPTRASIACRAILDRQIIHIRDMRTEPGLLAVVRDLGHKSNLAIPFLREGTALGAISLSLAQPGGFSDTQIELLKTFAEQAIIAISSADTYRALQTRTADLQESLEYQTATSDMLKVISRSTFDLQPVLDTVVETAARLCDAEQAVMSQREGESVRLVANFGFPPEYEAYWTAQGIIPIDYTSQSVAFRTIGEGRVVHIHDVADIPDYPEFAIRLGKQRTSMSVPLMREGDVVGNIVLARQRVEPFTDRQIGLVSTFADQAVIAIENTRLLTEQREALDQQTATAEVLQVINASPGQLAPVFDAMLEKATRLCEAACGQLATYDGEFFRFVAAHGDASFVKEQLGQGLLPPSSGATWLRIVAGEGVIHLPDVRDTELYRTGHDGARRFVDGGGGRSLLSVALRKDDVLLGVLSIYRQEHRPFTEKQIALVQSFAAQAVIAMENARLITETREALEQQTATAEVLQVINASPGDLAPVFDALLEKAMRLCETAFGQMHRFDGEVLHTVALRNVPRTFTEYLTAAPIQPDFERSALGKAIHERRAIHVTDLTAEEPYLSRAPLAVASAELGGVRTFLHVPLLKDDAVLGVLTAFRQEVRPFTDKQIALLKNFAAQAVIAMENARLLDELRQRQEELRITFENMGDGVAMFDETQHLVAWNRKFQDILDVPDDIIARRQSFTEYVRYLADRGEYGAGPGVEEQVRHLTEHAGQYRVYERIRPDGRVIEIRHNPVPSGGFVLIFSDVSERKRNEAEVRAARDAAEEASRTLEAAFRELKAAQANLIQAEKMASLGQLTAGIAHEIKNPLNFVNNFAALSVDLLSELKETAAPGFAALTQDQRAEIEDVSAMLTSNLEKITEHGKRADGIVKAMLEHSRGSSAERRKVDLNVLIDEALNLAYHGARAQDQSFNITLERDFGDGIAPIEVNPQDMTRVFLNILSNGFYAANKRVRDDADTGFVPVLRVTTRDAGEVMEIRVRDNGTGIPAEIRDKLFQPFFTTKPTGEGTGLGLSITYDIVTKQHGGTITVDSEVDAFTEFVITLPRGMFATDGDRA